ncbi:unnamed protein product [Adineta steineri]|uniref:Polyketide synthase-like phosphopantetheine-binding domain-containing protein n=1 Tax=Adineta steineri TaxID=433720 RepID=A0A814X905_9BILA|nr:unnamed protein product [Adineta steineri]CAF1495960.1 unnamed protein product [Adineta steineri]
MKFLPVEPNSNILELFILPTDPFLAPDFAKNGPYSPGDLFLEEPPGSGYYTIQGRKDDILVHVTGEKTSALPMELVIRQHCIVERVVVLGHNRLCCAVLIQLNIEEASKHELCEIEKQVLTAVNAANKDAPSHSQIVPAMVKILPMSKRLPITAKGNVIRKLADLEYKDIIEKMYEEFLNMSKTDSYTERPCQQHSWTRDRICNYLQSTVAHVLNKPIETFADYTKSLHSLSLDSLTAVQLRNTLCFEFGQLEQNIIFEFPSIDVLADELLRITSKQQARTSNDPLHYKETEEIIDKYIDLMKAHKDQMIIASETISSDLDSNASKKRVVLITGANGSLGSHIMLDLMKKPQVKRVYCLLRGENATDRLHRAMQTRKQDLTVLLDTNRVVVLSMDLNDEKLGQTLAMYEQLQREVTDVIHSAWKMDFNMTIKDFHRECLQGLYHLLKLASNTLTQSTMRFHFISSISSAGSGLIEEIEEEPLPRQEGLSLPQGYGQSKYAGEHICWAAMDLWGELEADVQSCIPK